MFYIGSFFTLLLSMIDSEFRCNFFNIDSSVVPDTLIHMLLKLINFLVDGHLECASSALLRTFTPICKFVLCSYGYSHTELHSSIYFTIVHVILP